jgi:hypothetical protein
MTLKPEFIERPEPFATMLDLYREHGSPDILDALKDIAELESEDEDNCPACRLMMARLHMELTQLHQRMYSFQETLNVAVEHQQK